MSNLSNVRNLAQKNKELQSKKLSFAVQKVHSIDAETARVLIKVPEIFYPNLNNDNLTVAVASILPGVRYAKNSLHRVSSVDKSLFGMFVSKQKKVVPMEQASANGISAISDTVFQDEDDNIWRVENHGGSSFLVATVAEDINELLNGVRNRSIATASVNIDMEEDFGPGMFVKFYEFASEQFHFGIASNGSSVFDVERNKIVPVEAAHVVAVHTAKPTVEVEQASFKSDLLAYYKQLYGHNPEFYASLKKMINDLVAA